MKQLDLFSGDEEPCRRDHAGCGVHHAVWEARFATCWFVRKVGQFASDVFRTQWANDTKDWPVCVRWLSAAETKRIAAIGRGEE